MDSLPSSSILEIIKSTGHPVQLVTDKNTDGGKQLAYDIKALESILCDPVIASRHLSVISIIGPTRKGKSFLINFFMKYIFAKFNSNWLSNLDQSLDGFSWNCGLNNKTNGIVLWSEPFVTKVDNEERVILVLDVQGTFNKFSSLDNCTKLAAFSLLLSSHLLFNIPDHFDEQIYDFSELFINYANLIIGSWCPIKPFQNMIAVIRDWKYPNDFPYGLQGGELYLKHTTKNSMSIKLSPNSTPVKSFLKENTSKLLLTESMFKNYFRNFFTSIQCCLMPHPGLKAAMNANFDGRIRDIDPLFIEHVKLLVSNILCPENLQLKKMNNHFFTCKEYFQYFKSIIHILDSENFPQIRNIVTENAYVNQMEFIDRTKGFYLSSMDQLISTEEGYLSNEKLEIEHKMLTKTILQQLEMTRMFNKSLTIQTTKSIIENSLSQMLSKYISDNNNKNLNMSIFTPFSLILILSVSYFVYHLLNIIHITFVSFTSELIFYGILCTNLLWIAACFWDVEFISAIFDQITDGLIIYVFEPLIALLKTKPVKILNSFYQNFSKKSVNLYDE